MRKVIAVDDEYWILQGYLSIFPWQKYGYEVVGMYESPQIALDAIIRTKPDLVITDVRMPEMDGIELIRTATAKGCESLFVVVSGYSDFSYVVGAMRERAVDYVLKPVSYEDAEDLLNRIEKLYMPLKSAGQDISRDATDNRQLNEMIMYIDTHLTENLRLKDLAKQFFMNPTYCSEIFNKKVGTSFSSYLNRKRIEKSCQLLRDTSLSMDEVASLSGFQDTTHFHRVFKNMQGIPPASYRKRERKSASNQRWDKP